MSDIIVKFHEHEQVADELLVFAVIMTRHNNKWIFCRHKERDTYEIPGGHREAGESIDDAAKRELTEETGALKYKTLPISAYSVTIDGITTYGKLYFAEIFDLGLLSSESEIAEIYHFDSLPEKLTYPLIQSVLYQNTLMWFNR
ncbi:MAG: NUDIX domain-containing protein [Clostridiales bacterium]|nr:NUDIX domain-containing protein [Clostridiales bacterium]